MMPTSSGGSDPPCCYRISSTSAGREPFPNSPLLAATRRSGGPFHEPLARVEHHHSTLGRGDQDQITYSGALSTLPLTY